MIHNSIVITMLVWGLFIAATIGAAICTLIAGFTGYYKYFDKDNLSVDYYQVNKRFKANVPIAVVCWIVIILLDVYTI